MSADHVADSSQVAASDALTYSGENIEVRRQRATEQARGNPFLLVEFFHRLEEEGIVVAESGRATLVDERLAARVRVTGDARLARNAWSDRTGRHL